MNNDQIEKLSFKERFKSMKLSLKWIFKASPKITTIIFILSIIGGILVIVTPYIYKILIDYLTTLDITTTTTISFTIITILIVYVLTVWLRNYISELALLLRTTANFRIEKYVSSKLMKKISSLDLEHFEDSEFYNSLYKANQSLPQITSIYRHFIHILRYIVTIITILASLLIFDWRISLLVIIGSIPILFVSLKYANVNYSLFYGNSPVKREAKYYLELINSNKRAVKEIKLFSLRDTFLSKWNTLFKDIIKKQDSAVRKQTIRYFLAGLINVIFIFFSIILSINLYIRGEITIGSIVFLLALIFQFSNSLTMFFEIFGNLNKSASYIYSFVNVFNYKSKINNNSTKKIPKILSKGITFKNVFFRYPKSDEFVLKNINVTIKPGENIAIVGENGSGKTTFIKLLSRLYDVSDGEILIDNTNIKDYSLLEVHKNIGIIFQDFVQYEASVKENIKFGNVNRNNKYIHESAVSSGAYDFIKHFDKKYNAYLGKVISKDGKELSGGQWQKVALARAFFKDSQILILDEPTASIDAKAEYDLFKRFKNLTKGKTTILISHRFSTVRMADRIIVMDKGKIVEEGSHKQLMSKKGVYHKLFSLQAKGYNLK